jgi:hypothetical protein
MGKYKSKYSRLFFIYNTTCNFPFKIYLSDDYLNFLSVGSVKSAGGDIFSSTKA